jgi:hypothetical protein
MQEGFLPRPSQPDTPPSPRTKRLGGYLVEAGLLTPAQVDVVLNDQKLTGMRFGEILATRGWVKQQTIEYLMQKVILPEQEAAQQRLQNTSEKEISHSKQVEGFAPNHHSSDQNNLANRRDLPIAKPLPSVASAEDDVSWVG